MTRPRKSPIRAAAALVGVLPILLLGLPADAEETSDSTCEEQFATAVEANVEVVDDQRRLPDRSVTVCGFTADLPQLDSLHQTAESQGISMDEAIDLYGGQDDFVTLANDIRERYPDEYAGAEYVPGGRSWIAFRDAPSAAVLAMTAEEVEFIAGKGYSERELTATLESTFEVVAGSDASEATIGVIDAASGVVELNVAPEPGLTASAAADAFDRLSLPAPANSAIQVEVTIDESLAAKPTQVTALRGGGDVLLTSDGVTLWRCTTAFGVHGGSLDAVMTAHHCATENNSSVHRSTGVYNHYRGDGDNIPIYLVEALEGTNDTDASWYGNPAIPGTCWFNITDTTGTCASGSHEAVSGQIIQEYGQTTGRNSSEVVSVAACVEYPTHRPYCGMTITGTDVVDGGDSGGPWFSGRTAYGITSGEGTIDGRGISIYARVPVALDQLGVDLIT